MYDEEREEIERLLDDLESPQLEDGTRTVSLPCGAVLSIRLPEESPDLYAEAVAAELPSDGGNEARFRDLAAMNFFWRQLEGFTAALRDGTVMAETREDLARLGDEETFGAWLRRADAAVRTIREVMSAPRSAEERPDDEALADGNSGSEVHSGEEVMLWP